MFVSSALTGDGLIDDSDFRQTTHDKVRKRALQLVAVWTGEFEKDPTLGIVEECYENLKSKGAFPDQSDT